MPDRVVVIVAARNEADRIGGTLAALRGALPGAALWVADDASDDGTAEAALVAGAQVVSRGRPHGTSQSEGPRVRLASAGPSGARTQGGRIAALFGRLRTPRRAASAAARRARGPSGGLGKGANVTAAVEAALSAEPAPALVLLCDGDLGASAARLVPLVEAVRAGECDIAVAGFSRRVGGGFGLALGFARWAIRRRCGLETAAPISGQRAMRVDVLRAVLPFARGYGMEIGMTIDAVCAGYSLREYELDLSHRATRRSLAGFAHRARQLLDFVRAFHARRTGCG